MLFLYGLLQKDEKGGKTHIPFSLSPFLTSELTLQQLTEQTSWFNELILNISLDTCFLQETLAPAARTDNFTQMLLSWIPTEQTQDLRLLINRNDFLFSTVQETVVPKQVELNTISVSFPYLATQISHFHRNLYRENWLPSAPIPNSPAERIAGGILRVFQEYGHAKAAILVVVQSNERNIFDQLGLLQLIQKEGICVLRKTLAEIADHGRLQEGHLYFQEQLIAVSYFRTGYTPNDFLTEPPQKARQLIEASSCVKIPDLPTQLAGMKKIQQILTQPEVLAQFIRPEKAAQMKTSFVGMFGLISSVEWQQEKYLSGKELALAHPNHFVLKPQREGGGNNIYGAEIPAFLASLSEEEQLAYILMERIDVSTHTAQLVIKQNLQFTEGISEISRYGLCLSKKAEILLNQDAGYLVRTKPAHVQEGGVVSGYACLNSLALI